MQKADRATVPKERRTRCTTCCCRQRRDLSGEVPGKQFFDPVDRVVGDAFEDVTKITFVIDVSLAMPIRG
jgi:hypothetical protein